MPIVGPRPESGVRIEVERPLQGGPPWQYTGKVATPEASFPLQTTLGEDGSVDVSLPPDAPGGLDEKVRMLVRAAFRHAQGESRPPPRRIVRWRPDS